MKVFLDDHIAAAGEDGVFLADQRGVDRGPPRVFRAVDETKQVAVVEIFEPCTSSAAETRRQAAP